MISQSIIGLAIVAAIMAAALQTVWHHVATRKRWRPIPRYVAGITTVAAAFAAPIFAALPVETAATLYGLLWLIIGASGLATWLAYEADPPTPLVLDLESRVNAIIAEHDES